MDTLQAKRRALLTQSKPKSGRADFKKNQGQCKIIPDGYVSWVGQKVSVGDRPGACGPEGAGAVTQVPSFLGTKGDMAE